MTTFELEAADPELHNDVLTVCDLTYRSPERTQSMFSAIPTDQGIRLRIAVPGRHPCEAFRPTDGPRVEARFPRP